jgi:hypothetical protein
MDLEGLVIGPKASIQTPRLETVEIIFFSLHQAAIKSQQPYFWREHEFLTTNSLLPAFSMSE